MYARTSSVMRLGLSRLLYIEVGGGCRREVEHTAMPLSRVVWCYGAHIDAPFQLSLGCTRAADTKSPALDAWEDHQLI
jgi:hypothetical protein